MNLEQLRAFCLSFPEATEEVKWGHDLCFLINKKMFCITGFEEPVSLSLKASDEDFVHFTEREGIIPAPYLARYKWIAVRDTDALSLAELKLLISKSYEMIAAGTKKKTAAKKSATVSQKSRSPVRKTTTKPSLSASRKRKG